jgi:hypothetical protein
MNCCAKFRLYCTSGWPCIIHSLAGLLALRDRVNMYRFFLKTFSKTPNIFPNILQEEIYFTEKKINMHVYFIYKLISYQAF